MLLPPSLGIANEQMRDDLIRALASLDFVLDGSAVTRIDTAGIQLLCAFVAAVSRRGGRVTWQTPSPQLLQAAQTLRVFEHLGLSQS